MNTNTAIVAKVNENTNLIAEFILCEINGWVVTKDRKGRAGQRLVDAERRNDNGTVTCVAELRERVLREYDEDRDFWNSLPAGEWEEPALRPCFAPGVIT